MPNTEFLQQIATREDLNIIYKWMNEGESCPGPYTSEVDKALSRVLDSAELLLSEFK